MLVVAATVGLAVTLSKPENDFQNPVGVRIGVKPSNSCSDAEAIVEIESSLVEPAG